MINKQRKLRSHLITGAIVLKRKQFNSAAKQLARDQLGPKSTRPHANSTLSVSDNMRKINGTKTQYSLFKSQIGLLPVDLVDLIPPGQ